MMAQIVLLQFLFIILCANSDLFSFAQLSDMHIGIHDEALENLQETIVLLNSKIEEDNISFVLITGDLTHGGSGDKNMRLAKSEFDKLEVPYYIIPGNHDIYAKEDTENLASGGKIVSEVFSNIFTNDSHISHYVGTIGVSNPDTEGELSYFQNYQLEYNDIIFLMLDFNSRTLQSFVHQAWAGAEIHDFQGGSYQWLKERLEDLKGEEYEHIKKIVFCLHHPFYSDFLVDFFQFQHFAWYDDHEERMKNLFMDVDESVKKKIFGDISGHYHNYIEYEPFNEDDLGFKYKEMITGSTRSGISYRIVHVNENYDFRFVDFGAGWPMGTTTFLFVFLVLSLVCVCCCCCSCFGNCCVGCFFGSTIVPGAVFIEKQKKKKKKNELPENEEKEGEKDEKKDEEDLIDNETETDIEAEVVETEDIETEILEDEIKQEEENEFVVQKTEVEDEIEKNELNSSDVVV